MKKFLLLLEVDRTVLDVQELALKYFYGGDIHMASSNGEAINLISQHGKPEAIFADYQVLMDGQSDLLNYLTDQNMFIPVVLTSSNAANEKNLSTNPLFTAFLEKPLSSQEFTDLVKSITNAEIKTPSYVPVKFQTLMGFGNTDFNYYLRLSSNNFVKIIREGDLFTPEDADKLRGKGINEVYIHSSDCFKFLEALQGQVEEKLSAHSDHPKRTEFALESLEEIEAVSKALGWSQNVFDNTQKTVKAAISILAKDEDLLKTLNERLRDPSSEYSRHVGLLSYLSVAMGSKFPWVGETGQLKLVTASLLHDLLVDDVYYQNIRQWNARASDHSDKAPEVTRYRLHAALSAKRLSTLERMPADVDQIILQHHEKIDGTGFPRGLTASRITHLSTLFIILEDLVDFLKDEHMMETNIQGFIIKGQKTYTQGHFKKFFEEIATELLRHG